MRNYFLLAFAAGLLLGCATIVKGTDQQVSIDTPGFAGAQCRLSSKAIGVRQVVTPAIITLPKSKENVAVECNLGCARGTGVIASSLETMTAGNVLLGGVIGLGVDAATGAMNHYTDRNQIHMQNDSACQG